MGGGMRVMMGMGVVMVRGLRVVEVVGAARGG